MKLPLYSVKKSRMEKNIKVSANTKWSALNLRILKSIIIFTYPILIYLHPYFACISLCRLKWYTIYNFKSCFCCSLNLSHIWFHLLKIQDASFKNPKLSQAFKNQSQIFLEMDGGSAAGHEKIVRQKFKTICILPKKFFYGKMSPDMMGCLEKSMVFLEKKFKNFFFKKKVLK